MLVRSGNKKSYVVGGVLQILLAFACGFLIVPYTLSGFGISIEGWYDLVNGIFESEAGKYILAVLNFLLVTLFVINFFAMFFRKSFSSTFFKLASLLPLFMFACVGLENGLAVFGIEITFEKILIPGIIYPLVIASGICYVLGFIFQFTVNRKNPQKATTYQMAKGLVWILLAILNFLASSLTDLNINIPDWANYLFYYDSVTMIPYFFSWYFLLMGVWQCISSPKLVRPEDLEFSTGYPMPYGQPVYPQGYGYVPPQQPYYTPPVQPYYGPRQGLTVEEEKPEIESAPEENFNLNLTNEIEPTPTKEEIKEQPKATLKKDEKVTLTLSPKLPPKLMAKAEEQKKQEQAKEEQSKEKMEEKKVVKISTTKSNNSTSKKEDK